ncbi:MAG: carbonate dehydratase [Nevskia sp.]
MPDLKDLLENNRAWALRTEQQRPGFFAALAKQQAPEYLWIGCSDSRVPANEIIGLAPGEVFVHRNVGNVVVHTDLNCLSVIQFAIDVLKVKHIIIVGHYGCSGVRAALDRVRVGLADQWLQHIRQIAQEHSRELTAEPDAERRADRLCELNALHQAMHVCETTIVRDAWERGQSVQVHAWCYGLKDGRVHELGFNVGTAVEFAHARELFGERRAAQRGA